MADESLCFIPVFFLLAPQVYFLSKQARTALRVYFSQVKPGSAIGSVTLTGTGANPIASFNIFPSAPTATSLANLDENEPLFGGVTTISASNGVQPSSSPTLGSNLNSNFSIQTGSQPRAGANLSKGRDTDMLVLSESHATSTVDSVRGKHGLNGLQSSLNALFYFQNIRMWYLAIFLNYTLQRSIFINFMGFRHNAKALIMDLQDCWELMIRATLIYVLGNISDRVQNPTRRKYFYFLYGYFSVMYSIAFDVCPEGVQMSSAVTPSLGVVCLLILGPVLVLATLASNVYEVWSLNAVGNEFNKLLKKLYFGAAIGICVLFFHLMIFTAEGVDSWLASIGLSENTENIKYSVHIHHHHWSFLLCFLFRSRNDATFIAQAFMLAMMVHGIAYFGLEPIYRRED